MGVTNMLWGAAADRWGAKAGLIRSQIFSVVGMTWCGLAATAEQVLAGRVVQAVGGGPQSAALALTGALVPEKRIGIALGLMQTGQALGGALGPVIGGILGDRVGYRNSFLIAAGVIGAVSALAAVFVKEPARPPRSTKSSGGGFFSGFADVLRVPLLRNLTLLILLFQSAHQTVATFIPLRVQEIAPDPALVGTYSGAVLMGDAAGVALGSMGAGWLVARIGSRRLLVSACALATVSIALQGVTTTIPPLVLLRFVVGLALGCILTVTRTRMVQRARLEHRGSVLGVSQGAFAFAFAVGALVGSTAIAQGGLLAAFGMAFVLFAASTAWAVFTTRASDGDGKRLTELAI